MARRSCPVVICQVVTLLWLLSAACGGSWTNCGLVLLPPPYAIDSARSAGGPEAQLEERGGDVMQVIVRKEGEIFCSECGRRSSAVGVDSSMVQVTLTLTDGSASFPTIAHVPVLCAETIATCGDNSTQQLLLADTRARVDLLLGGTKGEGFPQGDVVSLSEKSTGGFANLVFHPMSAARGDTLCKKHSYATIQMLTSLLGKGGAFPALKQSIPFDVCSCAKLAATSRIPLLISLVRSSDPSMHNRPLQLLSINKPIHAAPRNEIHDLGGTSAQQLRSEGQASAQHRVQKQADEMLALARHRFRRQTDEVLRFERSEFTVSLAENVALQSVVVTLRAVAPEGVVLSYGMRSPNRNSDRLFMIEGDTGVVRTTGKLGRGRRDGERKGGKGLRGRQVSWAEEGGKGLGAKKGGGRREGGEES